MSITAENAHIVRSEYDTVYLHDQVVEHPDMRRLYENAKRDQWNVSNDIDWSKPVDPEHRWTRSRGSWPTS